MEPKLIKSYYHCTWLQPSDDIKWGAACDCKHDNEEDAIKCSEENARNHPERWNFRVREIRTPEVIAYEAARKKRWKENPSSRDRGRR